MASLRVLPFGILDVMVKERGADGLCRGATQGQSSVPTVRLQRKSKQTLAVLQREITEEVSELKTALSRTAVHSTSIPFRAAPCGIQSRVSEPISERQGRSLLPMYHEQRSRPSSTSSIPLKHSFKVTSVPTARCLILSPLHGSKKRLTPPPD